MRNDKSMPVDSHANVPASTVATPGDDVPEADDSPLDSIGKAITDPMKAGAEKEEPTTDGRSPEAPGH